MADVVEINNVHQLDDFRLAWHALLPQTPRASFFHTLDWLQTYWQWYGSEQKLRALVIRSEGKPIGFVPLCVRRDRSQVGNVRVLTYPLNDWGVWYGPIGPNTTACLYMAVQHLNQTPRDWDILDLRWVDPAGTDPSSSAVAMQAGGWQVQQSDYQHSTILEMADTDWETYRAGLPIKYRQELGRQQRLLQRDYQVEIERHRPAGIAHGDDEPRWNLYDDCVAIAKRSRQSNLASGNTLSNDEVSGFLRDCHEVAARLGMLDMMVLKLDGQPAAFQYNYRFDGNLFGLRMGFDPSFSSNCVSKALVGWMIEDSFARGDQLLDLGAGKYVFKPCYRTGIATSQRLTYYPRNAVRGQGVRLTQWLKSRWSPKGATEKK